MSEPQSEEKLLPDLVVTENGVPVADQADGIRRFKEACLKQREHPIDERLLQIRRSHQSARPNPTENPAWFHTHHDLTYVLALLDQLLLDRDRSR